LAGNLNNLGLLAGNRGDLESSSDYHKRALAIWEKQAPGSLFLAHSLNNLGSVAHYRGDLESASDYYKRTLAIQEKQAPGSLHMATILSNLGSVARDRGELESASDYYERALAIVEKQAPGSLSLATNLKNLGVVARNRGDLESASDYYKRALAIEENQAPGSLSLGISLTNLGNVAADRGDLESASDYHKRGLAITEKQAPGSLSLAVGFHNLGTVAHYRGDLESASDYYKRALAIMEKQAPGSLSLANSLNGLGVLARRRGDLESASDYYKRALAIQEKQAPGSLSLADSLVRLGIVAADRGDLESASDYYERALALQEKQAPGSLSLAENLINLGVVARNRGDLESASDYFKRALAGMEKQAPGSLSLAAGLHNLGNVAVDRGDLESASDYYKRALAIQEKQAPGSEAEAESHYQLARTLPKSNRVNQALTHFEQAITNLESQLGRLGGSDQDKTRFQGQKASYYRSYIDFLISQKEPEQAFAILERARARVLHQMISERDLVLSGPEIPSELEKKRKRAAFRYEKTQQALAEAYSDEARAEALRAELRNRRRDHDAVIEDIRKASPGLANLHAPKPLDLAGIQKELDVGTVLLSYSVHEEQIVLFVVVKSQALEVHNIDKGEAWLREKVGDLTSFIKNKDLKSAADFFDESSRELYQLLIEPAAKAVAKADRLLIIPDGPLSVLPFGALISGEKNGRNRYLIQDKPILTAVSATIFFEQKALPTNGTDRLTAFGDPVYPREESEGGFSKWLGEMKAKVDFRSRGIIETRGRSLAPLPGTREEVNTIARLYGNKAETLLGEEATEERAKQLSDDPGIVHFACHGLIDKRSPLDSSLALTTNTNFQEGEDNGFLQAWEIFESVRLNTDLLVLSACDTGLGKEEGTEGLVGLTRAFQFAGARTIAASYWKIADDTTALFMKRFYTHLKSGMRKDEAMRKAQIEFIEGTVSLKKSGWFSKKGPDISRPYYWAAFQLHGPGD
nr:tetratricopeptide repeat protein [Acidobacteriota bacterium]